MVSNALLKYVEESDFELMADVSKYEKINKIGQGTFGCAMIYVFYSMSVFYLCQTNVRTSS